MRAAGLIADLQTGFLASDAPWVTAPDRARAGRDLVRVGQHPRPRHPGVRRVGRADRPARSRCAAIASAVTRAGAPPELARPAERLTVAQALGLYTHGAAAATFEETRRGTLAPGMAADVTVLDGDPFAVDAGRSSPTCAAGRRRGGSDRGGRHP